MRRVEPASLLVALAAGIVAGLFTWQPGLASLYDDSVSYLLIAQAASPWGAAPAAVLEAAALEKYPPLLGWIVALAGGAFDWRIAHAVVAASLGFAVLAIGWLARTRSGHEMVGAGAALAFALLPGAWLNVKGILSEFPYMAFSFMALAFHASRNAVALPRGAAVMLGLLLAAATLTRTVGLALVAAIAVVELLRFARERDAARLGSLAWIVGLPLAALGAWYLLRPGAGEDAYAAYGARIAREAAEGLDVAGMALGNAAAIRDAWLNALLVYWGEPTQPLYLLAAGVGLVGLAAIGWGILRNDATSIYVALFLAVLLAWPFPGQMFRLALPVVPLVLVAFLGAWTTLFERLAHVQAPRLAPLGALLPLAAAVPATLFYIAPRAMAESDLPQPRKGDIAEFYRIPARAAAEANAQAQLGVFEDLRRIAATTPADARVLWYWPNYVALLAQRRGVKLERPRDAKDLAAQARAGGAGYLYLAELHPRDSARRDGDPMAPLAYAAGMGRVVWQRTGPDGRARGVLVELRGR